MHKIHLDTDLGGDIDDLCALALLLRWPGGVELTGITTVGELDGRRAGQVRYVLGLEGRSEIPVAAGADVSGGYYREPLGLPSEARYWPEPIPPAPGDANAALELLKHSLDQGATVVGIGPYTNLYLLDRRYPGILERADLCLMGGYVYPPRPGFPQWDYTMDFNVEVDVRSARHVLEHARPTLVPLSVTIQTALRRAYLPALRRAGALGELIARQAEAFAVDWGNEAAYGATCPGLPPDIVNFQHDPLACAVALGWRQGIEFETVPLLFDESGGWLHERIHPSGRPTRVVTAVDGPAFGQFWVEHVSRSLGKIG